MSYSYYVLSTNTGRFLGQDETSWVEGLSRAIRFYSYGDASECSQNFDDSVQVWEE